MGNIADELNYSELQKETLLQIKGLIESKYPTDEYLLNLIETSIDYNFYLQDEKSTQ